MVRTRIETTGYAPTLDEIAAETCTSKTGAHKHVDALVHLGKLRKIANRTRGIELVGVPDIRAVASEMLRAELARRGETLDALSKPEPRAFGRSTVSCAADSCGIGVQRGHLFCRRHWFGLPQTLRDTILRSYATRNVGAYQDSVSKARDLCDGGARR